MKSEIIKQVQNLINEHKITRSQLKHYDGRKIVPVKYTDPETGKTWTGRGKKPKWYKD